MKRKIFIKFFSIILASTLLMFIFGLVAVSINAENVVKGRLIEETKIVALLLDSRDDFKEFKAYEGNDKFRITVFDTEGNVLIESDTPEELENHSDRIEVQNALNDTPATVKRYSETFKCEMTYYAMKVTLDDQSVVVLRIAIRSSEVSAYLSVTIPLFIVVLIVDIILALVIAHLISKSISSRVVEVGNSLKSVNKGEYVPIEADDSEPELYSVLCEINELSESTHSHILEIEGEHKKLNMVLESISQGIIAINEVKEIVFVNKSALTIFSGNEDSVGKELANLIDEPDIYNRISRHVSESYTFECEYKERGLAVSVNKMTDGLAISSIIVITDISAERAVAKQKSDFFANASHELKTPITVMQGLSELLLEDEGVSEGASKKIERIHKESVRLSSLISDMLKLSKLESGDEVELSSVSVSLYTCFAEALEELAEKMSQKNITYTLEGDATIMADPKKLYEIAQNLCSNAVNYNKDGGRIDVIISSTDTQAKVVVRDTGIGIEEKHIPRLCQRFYRVDKSHSKKTGGTGLGLAIVKHICALYGASMEIESRLDVGTSISLTFKK
ncbi:MAG: hypothetical protein IJ309_00055 [Clostridia bacterium]|nr:hypothetical protein [Clostridia bacterium]